MWTGRSHRRSWGNDWLWTRLKLVVPVSLWPPKTEAENYHLLLLAAACNCACALIPSLSPFLSLSNLITSLFPPPSFSVQKQISPTPFSGRSVLLPLDLRFPDFLGLITAGGSDCLGFAFRFQHVGRHNLAAHPDDSPSYLSIPLSLAAQPRRASSRASPKILYLSSPSPACLDTTLMTQTTAAATLVALQGEIRLASVTLGPAVKFPRKEE